MLFWLLVGVGLGYFFKPQLDNLLGKVLKAIQDNRNRNKSDFYD